jgi:hypothetical protein
MRSCALAVATDSVGHEDHVLGRVTRCRISDGDLEELDNVVVSKELSKRLSPESSLRLGLTVTPAFAR